jgi:hypothetical protein
MDIQQSLLALQDHVRSDRGTSCCLLARIGFDFLQCANNRLHFRFDNLPRHAFTLTRSALSSDSAGKYHYREHDTDGHQKVSHMLPSCRFRLIARLAAYANVELQSGPSPSDRRTQ